MMAVTFSTTSATVGKGTSYFSANTWVHPWFSVFEACLWEHTRISNRSKYRNVLSCFPVFSAVEQTGSCYCCLIRCRQLPFITLFWKLVGFVLLNKKFSLQRLIDHHLSIFLWPLCVVCIFFELLPVITSLSSSNFISRLKLMYHVNSLFQIP